MNKLVFQIGVLVFCVSMVYFGTEGADAIQMVSRSFMVFMVVVSGVAVIAMVVSSALRGNRRQSGAAGQTVTGHQGRETSRLDEKPVSMQ